MISHTTYFYCLNICAPTILEFVLIEKIQLWNPKFVFLCFPFSITLFPQIYMPWSTEFSDRQTCYIVYIRYIEMYACRPLLRIYWKGEYSYIVDRCMNCRTDLIFTVTVTVQSYCYYSSHESLRIKDCA